MAEYQPKTLCWSCGRQAENCECGKDSIPLTVKLPNTIMPICGSKNSENKEPWEDPQKFAEVILRPCCRCEKLWPCDYVEWVAGKCPNCGACGADGDGNQINLKPS